jgi:arylsulfatase A-like enzyme
MGESFISSRNTTRRDYQGTWNYCGLIGNSRRLQLLYEMAILDLLWRNAYTRAIRVSRGTEVFVKMNRLICLVLSTLFLALQTTQSLEAAGKGKAEHVVVVVWDGMRRDFITPQYTPTLYGLAEQGVFFKNHHPVYVSSTEVNGTAIATGDYPIKSGIMANSDYRPMLDWLGPNNTEGIEAIRRGDMSSDGHYILVPTLPEILHQAGYRTIIAGSKPVALLHDRALRRASGPASDSVVLYRGHTIPRSLLDSLVKVNDDKAFPTATTYPNTAMDAWTTKALVDGLWKKGVPKYTLLWLSEPDASQHETGPGSDTSLAAVASSDKNLKEVLEALDKKKLREKTDVLVVSDHGFSTISRGPDVVEILKKAGFHATKKFDDPEPGDILVVGLGGSVSFYVFDDDQTTIRSLVRFLEGTDFAGVIFSRVPVEGTFPLGQVRISNEHGAPDVLMAMRWTWEKNDYGAPGLLIGEGGKKGKGTHASLDPSDLRNTLVAAGPDFKSGLIDDLPSGNADVAPTILHLLGVPQPVDSPMDGRVLEEALVNGVVPPEQPVSKTIEASQDVGLFRWHQYLKFTEYAGRIYFDEGNGEPVPK